MSLPRARGLLVLLLAILTTLAAFPAMIHPASSSSLVGVVCIAESASTSCPANPLIFTGRIGSQTEVSVNIQGSNETYGFDVIVKTNPSVLDPVLIDYSGWIYAGHGFFVAVNCVDGVGQNCQPQDGPGVAHLAMTPLNFETQAPTTGRLFRVKYNILGSGPASIGFQTGCSPGGTSVPPDTCVTVVFVTGVDASRTYPDPEIVQPALFTHVSGDVNFDCRVDIYDLSIVGAAFGSTSTSPSWNSAADVNNDGVVNLFDLTIVASNFGLACS